MAINPLIPMQGTSVDIAGPANTLAQAFIAKQEQERRQPLLDAQIAAAKTQQQGAQSELLSDEDKSVIQGSFVVKQFLDAGDTDGARNWLATRKQQLSQYGVPTSQTDQGLALLEQDPTGQSLKSVVDANVAYGIQSGILGSDKSKQYAPSNLGKLITERDSLPEGHPLRGEYDRVIAAQGREPQRQPDSTPAAIREYEYRMSLSPADRAEWDKNKRGDKASTATEKEIFSAVDGAQTASVQYENYTDLANRYEQSPNLASGAAGSFAEWIKEQTGTQDAASLLRRDWAAVKASEVVKNLPPGAASDADVKMALAGFLPNNANPKAVASFLRGTAKLAKINGEFNSFKADYLSENKSPAGMLKAWRDYAKTTGSTMSSGNQDADEGWEDM